MFKVSSKIIFVLLFLSLFLYAKKDNLARNNNQDFQNKRPRTAVLKSFESAKDFKEISKKYNLSSDLMKIINDDNAVNVIRSMESIGNYQPVGNRNVTRGSLSDDLVHIYIYLKDDADVNRIKSLISKEIDYSDEHKLMAGWASVENLKNLGLDKSIRSIRPVYPPVVYAGSDMTEGDAIHRTFDVRNTWGNDGTGIKIGIISDGVNSRASAQATGDLPPDGPGSLTVLSDAVGGDEGTAMLEIVHDMVPGAELFFHDCGNTVIQFNSAISALASAGCHIICDDIGWILEPFFEDGVVASHVSTIVSGGVIYVSSAGNAGWSHHQAPFFQSSNNPNSHDFSLSFTSDDYMYCYIPTGGNMRIVLEWSDLFGSSGNDYDLFIYCLATGNFGISWNVQDGDDDPIEFINYTGTLPDTGDFAIIVDKYAATGSEQLEIFAYGDGSAFCYSDYTSPVDAIFGHSAANGVISCAAVDQGTPETVEGFSSQGPSTIFYPSFVERQTPVMTGVDGVSVTGAGSFPSTFYGTSAAAPHVAAVAAMIWSADLSFNSSQVTSMLTGSAVDLGAPGFDNVFGYGRADAFNVFIENSLPVELTNFLCYCNNGVVNVNWRTESESNNRGFIVERKADDQWIPISNYRTNHKLQGQGTTTEPTEYSFCDEEVIAGLTYKYRLVDVDIQGKETIHDDLVQTVTIPESMQQTVDKFALNDIYPNPFNPTTTISYQLAKEGLINIKIYNIKGQLVDELFNKKQSPGLHNIQWNATEHAGGIYIVRISNGRSFASKKCLVVK